MTLILTVNGPETIWLLADRRLSGRRIVDDAHKVLRIGANNGSALVGYAGLGATPAGTQPADWMSAVLRGRKLTIEESLNNLARVVKEQLPRHLARLPRQVLPGQMFLIPAFVSGRVRLLTIDVVLTQDRRSFQFKYSTQIVPYKGRLSKHHIPPAIAATGSGATKLPGGTSWVREILRLVRACDRGHVSHKTVATHLASINRSVHERDPLVGPRCTVAWIPGPKQSSGSDHYEFTGTAIDSSQSALPSILGGFDTKAISNALMEHMTKQVFPPPGAVRGEWQLPTSIDMNVDLSKVLDTPDEKLR